MNQIKIFPSLISSNILNLEKTITELSPYCDGFHLDIMDNHFVPNLTWGPDIINQIAEFTDKPLSIHLMVENPEAIIKQLRLKNNKSIIVIHIEQKDTQRLIELINSKKNKIGITLKPKTALDEIYPFLHHVDQVMLMSVEPGFSGQKFLPQSVDTLKTLYAYKKAHSLSFEIAMDGGINTTNIHSLYINGCTNFCIASAIFSSKDKVHETQLLYEKALEG